MPDRYLRFEHRSEPLASRRRLIGRLGRNVALASALIGVSLAIGIAGYRVFEGRDYVDAYLSAAMILSGMGPVGDHTTTAGKIFAGTYALYAGLVLVLASGLVLAPLVHRLFHHLHVECGEDGAARDHSKR